MYKIEFYENQHGESEVWDFLEALRVKSKSSKDARIQYNQILIVLPPFGGCNRRVPFWHGRFPGSVFSVIFCGNDGAVHTGSRHSKNKRPGCFLDAVPRCLLPDVW